MDCRRQATYFLASVHSFKELELFLDKVLLLSVVAEATFVYERDTFVPIYSFFRINEDNKEPQSPE